jgi:hypothetical protein
VISTPTQSWLAALTTPSRASCAVVRRILFDRKFVDVL